MRVGPMPSRPPPPPKAGRPPRAALRVLVALMASAGLIVPIGADSGAGPVSAAPLDVLAELARGSLGVGILDAFIAGGRLAVLAAVRVIVVAVLAIAFWTLRPRATQPVKRERTQRCPACGFETSTRMTECPSCGARIRE